MSLLEDLEACATWFEKEGIPGAARLRSHTQRLQEEYQQIEGLSDSCSEIERGVLLRINGGPIDP